MKDLFNEVSAVFDYATQDGDLVVAIDLSGVYVFGDFSKTDLNEVVSIKDDLELSNEECVVVNVSNESVKWLINSTLEDLNGVIMQEVLNRPPVFSNSELTELLECYGISRDASRVVTVPQEVEKKERIGSIETRKYFVRQAKVVVVLCLFGFLVLALQLTWWLPFIPLFTSLMMASKLSENCKLPVVYVLMVLSIVGLVLTALIAVAQNFGAIQVAMQWLRNLGDMSAFSLFSR